MVKKNINQGFHTPPKDYYKVYVRSSTYNQSPYIEDCLNGVAMQKTNFPFVHHVVDDCSTDGEQDVIKSWIERECNLESAEFYDNDICTITLAKHKSNANYTIAAYFLKRNMYGNPKKRELFMPWREVCPYIALCEGDDYWIEPIKLQKQVDYLDAHEKIAILYTDLNFFYQETCKEQKAVINNHITKSARNFCDFLKNASYIAPCTWMIRMSADIANKKHYVDGSFAMALNAFAKYQVGYLPIVTATYRNLYESASHSKSLRKQYQYSKGVFDIQKDYISLYSNLVSQKDINYIYTNRYIGLFKKAVVLNDFEIINDARAFFVKTFNWKQILVCYFPMFISRHIFKYHYIRKGYAIDD